MEILDDSGRLFGTVNVIDALVILLVGAVLLAGAVFVLADDPGDPNVRYATVDLGEQPDYVVSQLAPDDVMEPEGTHDNITVTDTHVGPDGHLLMRVAVQGEIVEVADDRFQFHFAGEPFRSGQALTFETVDYEVEGTVTALAAEDDTIPATDTSVVTMSHISEDTAQNLDVGDTYTVEGTDIATIESKLIYPGEDETVALLGLSLDTYTRSGTPHFGNEAVRSGATIPFETADYALETDVRQRGSYDIATDTTEVVLETTVSASEAESITTGDTYTVAGESVAEITDVARFPTDDPDTVHVRIGAEYTTYEDSGSIYFGDQNVRTGESLPFVTDAYELEADITQRGSADITRTTQSVVIDTTIANAEADRLEEGDTFSLAGDTVAEIGSVTLYPTADRNEKRAILGIDLEAEQRDDRRYFGEQELRDGTAIPFRTAGYDLTGDIIDPDGTDEPGELTTTEVTLTKEDVRPSRADRIQSGMTETLRGTDLATITDRAEEPSEVIIESDDGDIFAREHPSNLDLTLTADLQTRETTTDLRFHGDAIREGDSITLDLGRLTIEVEVAEIHD